MFKNCQYICGAVSKTQYPNTDNLPEFLFLGRSNVGKSSLINALTNRKALAYTSQQPGKTQVLNFYLIEGAFYFVDAPGYGYAIRSKAQRRSFGRLIEEYIKTNENLRFVFLLVDAKVGPTDDDKMMYDYLLYYNITTIVIATKTDKVGSSKMIAHRNIIINKLGVPDGNVILVSSLKKSGLEQIAGRLSEALK